eukprot:TRINITY_DN11057_c0_g1_i1.p1 TRINITY_DN11057_c0_g1~~TRINITY_DN11057_c0_g1_i1.p1  ORF type:complete len:1502 (+),score=188.41 TRINITY_DN11057_c0_g1_i1:358-4506(+)
MTPQPAVRACLTMVVKLDALGAPGVTLTMSISGETEYDICTRCFTWNIDSDLAFNVGLDVLGVSVEVGFNLAGGVKLSELTCVEASESPYCEWAHVFLPPEARMLESAKSTCHTDSPFESINAFLKYQWQALKAKVEGHDDVYINELDKQLHTYGNNMAKYPALFKEPHQADIPRKIGERILVATCVKSIDLKGVHAINADPFCQLEIALAEDTVEDNYLRVYGGIGPKTNNDCTFNMSSNSCDYPDRCWFKPSLHKSMRKCKLAPKFMGEVWRSSILDRGENSWDESHGFALPNKNSNTVRIYAHVYDWDDMSPSDRIGEGEVKSVEVKVGESVRVKIPLQSNLMPGVHHSSGFLVVQLKWLSNEPEGPDVGALRKPLEAMSAAVEGFVGKLPDYALQVGSRLENDDDDEPGINYAKLSGRYLARWLRPEVREDVERDEIQKFEEQDEQTTYVEDIEAPRNASGCRWNKVTSACEPALYCEASSASSAMMPIRSHACQLREIAELQIACLTDLSKSYCCNARNGVCPYKHKQPCLTKTGGMTCACKPGISCTSMSSTCECEEGLCYNSTTHRCELPLHDCTKGTREQQRNCQNKRIREKFEYRLGKVQPRSTVFQDLAKKVKRLRAKIKDEPCASTKLSSDQRVMNFARAMKETKLTSARARDAFFAEVVTSAANLFVRTVADVQAMFNLYFANNPNWDDDCLTLEPTFQNLYEFSDSSGQQSMRTQPYRSNEWPSSRVKADGTAEMPGQAMKDKNNPWCKYTWAAGERLQSQRVQFTHKDPPRGGSGIRTSPRELHGTMMPHLWCVLAEEFRSSNESQSRPFGDERYRRGWTLNFVSACTQLGFVGDEASGDQEASMRFQTWRRYDCEQVILGSAFLSFFPKFARKVEIFRKLLGTILEDTLQCTGRVDSDAREFPAEWEPRYESLCDVSAEALLGRKKEPVADTMERSDYIEDSAWRALRLLRTWVGDLRVAGTSMLSDFQELWSHGEHLTGLAFHAGDGIRKAKELLGDDKAVEDRVNRLKEHLVTKAWRSRGQTSKALFPVPVKYETHVEIGFHANFGESRDICKIQLPPGLQTTFQYFRQGTTYLPHASSEQGACASGAFAPIKNFQVSLRGCSRTVATEDGNEQETSWSIGFSTIFAVDDIGNQLKTKLRDAFTKTMNSLTPDDVKRDKVTSSLPWNMAKSIMANPTALLSGDLRPFADALKSEVEAVAGKLSRLVKEMSAGYLDQLGKALLDAMSVLALSGKIYRMLDIQIRFSRVGSEPYRTKFTIKYKQSMDASVSIALPGLVHVDSHVHLTQRYDMSEVFAIVFSALKSEGAKEAYKSCLRCLDKPRHVFCYNKASKKSSCPVGDASSCEDKDVIAAIVDLTDCTMVDPEG